MTTDVSLKDDRLRQSPEQPDLRKSRWDGKLSKAEYDYCLANGIAVGFDPAQQGWVALDCPDAFGEVDIAAPKPAPEPELQLPPMRIQSIDLERRYTLRLWTEDDVPAYVALLDNPKVWALMTEDYPDPLTPELASDMIAMSAFATRHDVRAIEAHDELIGQVRLLHGPEGATDAEISYWLGEPHWGKGHSAHAITLFAYQSFRTYPDLQSIFARIHKDNAASRRSAEKAHFVSEGTDPRDPDWEIWRVERSEFWLS
jgi:RimJ/RimL family protein N-acetyltransferase